MSFDDLDDLEIEIAPKSPHQQAKLYLVDGNNLAYKAFFAVQAPLTCKLADWPVEKLPVGMSSMDELPTNAIYGFANMIHRLWDDDHAQAIIVAWDDKPTARVELLDRYKAHRPERPEPLKQQFPFLAEIAAAFGCVNARVEGWEADDVLGTLAKRAERAGIGTCIVSNDRDMFQLVSDSVCVMTTPKGFNDPVVYTPEKVLEKYGVRTDQVIDYLGLKGDPGDGIPGVPKIGEKTASKLLQEHGTLEQVLEVAPAMKDSQVKRNLVEFAQAARDSKTLATIRCDLELDCDPASILAGKPDRSQLIETLTRFQLTSLLKRAPALLQSW